MELPEEDKKLAKKALEVFKSEHKGIIEESKYTWMLRFLWSVNYREEKLSDLIWELRTLKCDPKITRRLRRLVQWMVSKTKLFHKIFPWLWILRLVDSLSTTLKDPTIIPSEEEREAQMDKYEDDILLMIAYVRQQTSFARGTIQNLREEQGLEPITLTILDIFEELEIDL
jgi:hypothetical protein